MSEKKNVNPRLIGAAVATQLVIGGLTVRDIDRRDSSEVRGPRLLWKLWGGTNTLGSLAYWLVGRRRGAATTA